MARVSMSDVWDDARGFFSREAALLLPPALATIGLGSVLLNLVVPDAPAGRLAGGPWAFALLPVLLLLILGQLAVSTLVVVPRSSVREALAGAFARLPGAVLASLVTGFAVLAILLVGGIAGQLVAAGMGGGAAQAAVAGMVVAAPGVLWLFVRLMPLLPMLAATPPTLRVLMPIRASLALTKGRAGTIAGAVLAFFLAYLLILAALEFAGGTILLLAGRAIGMPALGTTLAVVLISLVGSVLQTLWAVFQAMLYRRLAAG